MGIARERFFVSTARRPFKIATFRGHSFATSKSGIFETCAQLSGTFSASPYKQSRFKAAAQAGGTEKPFELLLRWKK